jgi:hypothetical protein
VVADDACDWAAQPGAACTPIRTLRRFNKKVRPDCGGMTRLSTCF